MSTKRVEPAGDFSWKNVPKVDSAAIVLGTLVLYLVFMAPWVIAYNIYGMPPSLWSIEAESYTALEITDSDNVGEHTQVLPLYLGLLGSVAVGIGFFLSARAMDRHASFAYFAAGLLEIAAVWALSNSDLVDNGNFELGLGAIFTFVVGGGLLLTGYLKAVFQKNGRPRKLRRRQRRIERIEWTELETKK